MQKEVLQWLKSGADPKQGIKLLEKFSKNTFLIRLVKSNPVKNVELLKKSLCQLTNIDLTKIVKHPSVEASRISFREEFPFLNSPDCPYELKALVTDKFSSYYRYKELHKKLSDCTSLQECANTAGELLASYLDNLAIYAELNYYKQHKSVLGKHPVFKHYHRLQELKALSIKDLVELQRRLNHNIWRIESEISKGDKPNLDEDRKQRLILRKNQLSEVDRLLY